MHAAFVYFRSMFSPAFWCSLLFAPIILVAMSSTANAIFIDGDKRPSTPVVKYRSDGGLDGTGNKKLAERIPALPHSSGLLPARPPARANESALESLAVQLQAAMGAEQEYKIWLMDLEAAHRLVKSDQPKLRYAHLRFPKLERAPQLDQVATEVQVRLKKIYETIPGLKAEDAFMTFEIAWDEAEVQISSEIRRVRAHLDSNREQLASLEGALSRALKINSPEKLSEVFDEYQKTVGALVAQEAAVQENLRTLREAEQRVAENLDKDRRTLQGLQAEVAEAQSKLDTGVANLQNVFAAFRDKNESGRRTSELKGGPILQEIRNGKIIEAFLLAEMNKINSMAAMLHTDPAGLRSEANMGLTFHVISADPVKRWGLYTSSYSIKGIVTARAESLAKTLNFENGPVIEIRVAKNGKILKGEALFSEGFRLWSEMSTALAAIVGADHNAQAALLQVYSAQPDILTEALSVQDKTSCVEVVRNAVRNNRQLQ